MRICSSIVPRASCVRVRDVGDRVVEPSARGGQLLHQRAWSLRVGLVLEQLRDPGRSAIGSSSRRATAPSGTASTSDGLRPARSPPTGCAMSATSSLPSRRARGSRAAPRTSGACGSRPRRPRRARRADPSSRLEVADAVLRRDQLLGLAGEALLGDPEQVVDLGTGPRRRRARAGGATRSPGAGGSAPRSRRPRPRA